MTKVAINGLGRIGRAVFKILHNHPELELAAVNDLVPTDDLAYLLKYDSVYGKYNKKIEALDDALMVDDVKYPVFGEKDPARLPWKDLEIDIVFECTGIFKNSAGLSKHLEAGARQAILSAPAKSDDIPTVVYGANEPEADVRMLSCASCTTNCITPVIEIIGRRIGVRKAIMTTIHAYTASQGIVDMPHKKRRRGRAAALNFAPTSTGAAKATAKALPQYKGKFDGAAIRGPAPVGSIADITMVVSKYTSPDEINNIIREEAASDRYKDSVAAIDDEIVSSDIIQDPHGSVIDLTMTKVVDGDLVKVMAWYDNEWGYANQMVRTAVKLSKMQMAPA